MVSTTAILTLAITFFGVVKASPINLGPDVEVELDKRQSKPTFFIKSKTITGTVNKVLLAYSSDVGAAGSAD